MKFKNYRIYEAEDKAKDEKKDKEKVDKTDKTDKTDKSDKSNVPEKKDDGKRKIDGEFNQEEHVKDAEEWLEDRFGDQFTFKHTPNLSEIGKTYHASINDKEFMISGKSFDTTGDNQIDTVLYRIDSIEEEPEEKEPMF